MTKREIYKVGLILLAVLLIVVAGFGLYSQNFFGRKAAIGQEVFAKYCKTSENSSIVCEGGPFAEFGCDKEINSNSNQDEYLKGLSPRYPIMTCRRFFPLGKIIGDGVAKFYGGSTNSIIDYIIFRNDKFELISSQKQFNSIFAPIETREEALAYVVALRKGKIVKDTAQLSSFTTGEYVSSKYDLKPTSVEPDNEAFRVVVFSDLRLICNSTISEITLLVRYNGEIKEISSKTLWRNNGLTTACVD